MVPELETRLLKVFHEFPEVEFVALFGSRAEGVARMDSDVDLAIAGTASLSLGQMNSLREALVVALGLPVDLIDLMSVEGPVLHEALSRGRIVKGRNSPAHEQALLRMIWWQDDNAPLYRQCLREQLTQSLKESA